LIEKRAKERIPASIDAKHFVGNSLYAGTVKNLSENGIYINSDFCLPTNSLFELLISLNENVSNIPAWNHPWRRFKPVLQHKRLSKRKTTNSFLCLGISFLLNFFKMP